MLPSDAEGEHGLEAPSTKRSIMGGLENDSSGSYQSRVTRTETCVQQAKSSSSHMLKEADSCSMRRAVLEGSIHRLS